MSEDGYIIQILFQSAVAEWISMLSLIFGGCCSNALALELATSQDPHAGTLITFAQFLLVSLYGLRRHLIVAPVSMAPKELFRQLSFSILDLRSKKPFVEHVYVSVEGHAHASDLFTKELVHEIKLSSHKLNLKRFSFTTDTGDVPSVEILCPPDTLADSASVVFIHGPHFPTGLHGRCDYSICLVSSEGNSCSDYPSPCPVDSSLTVDITTPTHPVIIAPNSRWLTLWDAFQIIPRLRLKNRSIPVSGWAIQVALFLLTSLLNNAAFGYNVPMTVHIIFRSGGLVINMLMGWLIDGRRYNATQIFSVTIVTLGVVCTTLSAQSSDKMTSNTPGSYVVGILILILALVMSGFMGLAQDRAYAQYGRGHWQEAMFYLHFLALPGFAFVWRDLARQMRSANASTRVEVELSTLAIPFHWFAKDANMSITFPWGMQMPFATTLRRLTGCHLSMPSFYFPLLLNIVTQLLCVSGVHRLTSHVNSLTVTLVLVVRKAVSLGISALLLKSGGSGMWLWFGAALVFTGTIGYAVGGRPMKMEAAKGRDVKED